MLAGNKNTGEAISAAQHFAGCCCVAILTECGSADISRVYPENRCNGTPCRRAGCHQAGSRDAAGKIAPKAVQH